MLDQYVGHYEQGLVFTRAGNSLYIEMAMKKIRMCAATNESFYMTGTNGIAEFTKDNKGKVTGISFKTADGNFYSKKLN